MDRNVNALSPPCRKKPAWGRSHASWWSYLTFSWCTDLLKTGKQRQLVEDDVDDLDLKDTSQHLLIAFLTHWNDEISKNPNNDYLLLKVLFKTIGIRTFSLHSLTLFAYLSFQIINVVCLQQILSFIEKSEQSNVNRSDYTEALYYCMGITLSLFCLAFQHHWYFWTTTKMGLLMKQVLAAAILYKTMEISPNSVASAKVMNLMGTDSERFQLLFKLIAYPLTATIYMIPALLLLSHNIGNYFPCLGFVLYIVIIPIQIEFLKRFGKLRDQAVSHTDQRLKLVNEVLLGCLAMKMYCWEKALSSSINKCRQYEMKYIKRAAMIKTFNMAIYFASQALIAAIVFLPYFYSVGKLESSIIYPILTFFALFKLPILYDYPLLVQLVSEIRVSTRRITQFLKTPQISKNQIVFSKEMTLDVSQVKLLNPSKFATTYSNSDADGTYQLGRFDRVISLSLIDNTDLNKAKRKENVDNPTIHIKDATFSWDLIPIVTLRRVFTSKKEQSKSSESSVDPKEQMMLNGHDTNRENGDTGRHKLSNIRLKIDNEKGNRFVAIVGKIGSGKSSLLSAILGELPLQQDNISNIATNGKIGYACQKAWIFSSSVRENILFGQTLDEGWYQEVIIACSLLHDFEQLPHGDETIIGERGINLSVGQKTRIGLARAVYTKADILLLDDPLASVDSLVAQHIFDNVFDSNTGIAKDSIRVLVTHQTQFLHRVDSVVVMQNGTILHNDSLNNLKNQGINIKSLVDDKKSDSNEMKSSNHELVEDNNIVLEHKQQSNDATYLDLTKEAQTDSSRQNNKKIKEKAQKESIVSKEEINKGRVSWESYISLFYVSDNSFWGQTKLRRSIFQGCQLILVLSLMIGAQICLTSSEYWLGTWADSKNQEKNKYSIGFITLLCVCLMLAFGRAVVFYNLILKGARYLHDGMFMGVLYSPMSFFEKNPLGRIINRFSKDQWVVDEMLPETAFNAIERVAFCSMTIFSAAIASPFVLILMLPCAFVFRYAAKMYLSSSRAIKRLDGKTRSPIFALFSTVYDGLPTIRAFDNCSIMLEHGLNMIDINTRMQLMFEAVGRWLGVRLDFTTSLLTISTCFISVYMSYNVNNSNNNDAFIQISVSPASIGLVLSYLITSSVYLQWAVKLTATTENFMTSTERILEYKNLTPEKGYETNNNKNNVNMNMNMNINIPQNWPHSGKVEIKNLCAKYREHLDLVLKNINLTINSNEKIGIVGRTGSGKSSLFLTFFRILESCSGGIFIDGIDTKNVGLERLRSSISIIPQDPVLFSETIRYNIDPFEEYTNDDVFNVLKIVNLYDMIVSLPNGLNTHMAENGSNFSVGEAQLICVARALLNKETCLLLVDEGTSSVDPNTDNLIQKILKEKFENKTVLTIAHRIQTILHCDKIVVMESGTVVEFDTPKNLLNKDDNDQTALFKKMYKQAVASGSFA